MTIGQSFSVPRGARCVAMVLIAACILLATGCASPPTPRSRTGSLPFPGLLTLFAIADADNLDPHSYGPPLPFKSGSRGIVYTEKAGFIDMSHVRWTIDWAWYYHQRAHAAITAGKTRLRLPTGTPSRIHMRFHYPSDWDDLPDAQRQALTDELALRIGQETAWLLGLWYETITYFGYASLILIPEDQSAFTYEDNFSHAVGLHVFERALADPDHDFEDAVTLVLHEMLQLLEPYDRDATYEAARAVEGLWWEGGRIIRRNLDLGLNGNPVRPWLIPDSPDAGGRYGPPWHVPGMHDFDNPHLANFLTIAIAPRIFQANAIREAAGSEDRFIRPHHFIPIVEHIRTELYEAHGPHADRP